MWFSNKKNIRKNINFSVNSSKSNLGQSVLINNFINAYNLLTVSTSLANSGKNDHLTMSVQLYNLRLLKFIYSNTIILMLIHEYECSAPWICSIFIIWCSIFTLYIYKLDKT